MTAVNIEGSAARPVLLVLKAFTYANVRMIPFHTFMFLAGDWSESSCLYVPAMLL